MNKTVLPSKLACGVCVIAVTLLGSGCTTRQPMSAMDLSYFQIDCSRKKEQIQFLNSMRVTDDDRIINGITNILSPWERYQDSPASVQRQQIHRGRTNWLINQKLSRLAKDCP